MINRDIQETKDVQKISDSLREYFKQDSDELSRSFKQDMEDAYREMEKIEKRDRRWQLILSFYFGVVFTIVVEVIGLLIHKGIHG